MLCHSKVIFIRTEISFLRLVGPVSESGIPGTHSPADWMPAHKLTETSRIMLIILNLTTCPYDERAFSPLDATAGIGLTLALVIYIFVSFWMCSETGKWFGIERRQVVFHLCVQDSYPFSSLITMIVSKRLIDRTMSRNARINRAGTI